ncbi:hypothetical protein OH76DRAFT_506804 [Lentinus brumalis]|uniref:Uncharacterized protein n=1 Tax=Lentinus brumalis TaxID=2498619 RepID=A0A371DAY4_9APHY|nr:hypothetical protein OH76DRAFT_506804 [Polyporus brumalis]
MDSVPPPFRRPLSVPRARTVLRPAPPARPHPPMFSRILPSYSYLLPAVPLPLFVRHIPTRPMHLLQLLELIDPEVLSPFPLHVRTALALCSLSLQLRSPTDIPSLAHGSHRS